MGSMPQVCYATVAIHGEDKTIKQNFFRDILQSFKIKKPDLAISPQITMTLLVRNEQDIISQNIRFHHAMGVDKFIVMDNLSTDATAQIVKTLSRDIDIDYMFQPKDDYNQWQWVTEMAQRAAIEHKSDWVINNDADEFWVPQGGDFKSLLGALPLETSVLRVARYNAVVFDKASAHDGQFGHPETSDIFVDTKKHEVFIKTALDTVLLAKKYATTESEIYRSM